MSYRWKILDLEQVDPLSAQLFFQNNFSDTKSEFLTKYGAWWQAGGENLWFLQVEDQLVGYCGVIPTRLGVDQKKVSAIWWNDIVIAPEHRGNHYQTHFDEKIRNMDILKLGFPNALAAKIHRKHGWGVKEDLQTRLLPLRPLALRSINNYHGVHKSLLKLGASALSPLAWIWRKKYLRFHSEHVWSEPDVTPEMLAGIFDRHYDDRIVTTWRDFDYFQNRFFRAPYLDELRFYFAGPSSVPTHYLVARFLEQDGYKHVRILDMFGDFNDVAKIRDLVGLVIKDALIWDAKQIIVLVTFSQLHPVFNALGFIIRGISRFCWYPKNDYADIFENKYLYFTLADSDNDSIE